MISLQLFALNRPAEAELLKGRIVHSESLPPLDNGLAPGTTFDAKATALGPPSKIVFFQIPAWLAGSWQVNSNTQTSSYDYKTRKQEITPKTFSAKYVDQFGSAVDGKGRYWQLEDTPKMMRADQGQYIAYYLLKENYPLEMSDRRIVTRALSIDIKVDKATQRIASVKSVERLQTYTLPVDNTMTVSASVKEFDIKGTALAFSTVTTQERKIAPFKTVGTEKMRKLLDKYLLEEGELPAAQQGRKL